MTRRMLGAHERLAGYVTTMSSIVGRTAPELERSLGFNDGSLADGFLVYALDEPVGPDEFEWKDRTTYSDGWHYDWTIDEFVQRRDELRAHLGKRNDYDETKTDGELLAFMGEQARRLNVRSGPERIVKVLAKGRIDSFPDSRLRNVPQWRLRVGKAFTRLADVGPGARFV